MMRLLHSTVILLLTASAVAGQEKPIDGAFFRQTIRPILSDKCFTCHGPDQQTREGGFRFDLQDSAMAEADSGAHPIVPGMLEESELVKRIEADDDSRMPPRDQEKQLTDDEKEALKRWIKAGAPWQSHWAFERPQRPAPPKSTEELQPFVRSPIDQFIVDKWPSVDIQPSGEADRITLIRRLSFDLIGLPPTPEEVDAFLKDDRDDAYEHLVDRLMASPHYGEKMASGWLDAARFADTNGYQNDFARNMWPWRDWLIDAYNRNLPYDQFVLEQLAGDMLPDATKQQKIASGFNRNNRSVTEGGSIEAEWHVENVVDRVETTATVFLGLTMGCARCHDHKYDPISQKEFYEFFAYFNSSKDRGVYNERRGNFGPILKVPSETQQERIAELEAKVKANQSRQAALARDAKPRQVKWESSYRTNPIAVPAVDFVAAMFPFESDTSVKPDTLSQPLEALKDSLKRSKSPFAIQNDDALVVTRNPKQELKFGDHFAVDGSKPFSISVWVRPTEFGAILSRMDAASAYRGYDLILLEDGRVNVHLIHDWPRNGIKITTKESVPKSQWSHLMLTYDGSQKAKGMKVWLDQRPLEVEVNNDNLNGMTLTEFPFWIGSRTHTPSFAGQVADLRLYHRSLNEGDAKSLFQFPIQKLANLPNTKRSDIQQELLQQKYHARFATDLVDLKLDIERLRRQLDQMQKQIPTTMVMEELPTPRKTYRLNRGQYDQPDKSVELEPGVPAFLPQPQKNLPANRLGLAKWLVDPQNPLTARVAVNRLWQQFFGAGLLETPENFGVQAPLPSHPELLDWLAVEFIESGWDVKALQKKMVMSGAYRRASNANDQQRNIDPINRWLARGARFRLPAEAIRDNALAVSGLLNPQIGGPSMKPYQPAGVWKELAGGAGEKPYVQAKDGNLYRRSMYIYRKRTVPHPTMSTFDAGSREVCQVARQRTNTPLQALALLNDPTYVEAARALATDCLQKRPATEAQIKLAFRRTLARNPSEAEFDVLVSASNRYVEHFSENPTAADELLAFGELDVPDGIDRIRLAAMTAVCSTLLNLDESITRE